MSIAAQLPMPNLPSAALLRGGDGLRLATGESVAARSLGQNSAGQTLLAVGRQVVALELPQRPPAGTALTITLQADGKLAVAQEQQPGQTVPLPAAMKAELRALLLANAGKVMSGQVVGSNSDGSSKVMIGKLALDLLLPEARPLGTELRLAVEASGNGLRLLPGTVAQQPAILALAVAVAPASQATLERLSLRPGQVVQAQVLANLASGETEILVEGQKLTVTLPQSVKLGERLDLRAENSGGTTRLKLVSLPLGQGTVRALPSPLQALLAAVSEAAMAEQDSLAPALASLNRLLPRLHELPAPVARAAVNLLSAQVALDEGLSGEELKQAILRSGVFVPNPGGAGTDIKSALLQLRSALLLWLAPDQGAAGSNRRTMPPQRGGQPRSQGMSLPAMEEAGDLRALAKSLLGEAGAALHRLRLLQLNALPDAQPGAPAEKPGQVMVEVPLRLGQELCMAQFVVGGDGQAATAEPEAKRSWQLRFSVNFAATGEVGAQIVLWGRKLNVSLWAERGATADVLEGMLPEMEAALAGRGLEAVTLRCRSGVPRAASTVRAGQYLDATG